jgi:uncharacterized protein (TIGR03435 family)
MKPAILGIILIGCAGGPAFSQSSEAAPKFEIADVRPASPNAYFRAPSVSGGRYGLKGATMVDLIRTAYGIDAEKVVGGPSWLEMDRFDVLAKLPAGATAETAKPMLQSLLAERFKLAFHKDTRPFPAYALTAGKKPQLKEAAGTEEAGCRQQAASGAPGANRTVQYNCRDMTMAAFAEGLRRMAGASLSPTPPVSDETGLNGKWNFDLTFSPQPNGLGTAKVGDQITLAGAIEQQLGLKLEERQVPTPVIVVDSVNRKPSENPPGTAEVLPVIPAPTEFEVASVKPTDPSDRMGNFNMQPGGRLTVKGMPLRFLIMRAFAANNSDTVVGLPSWADTERFDIIAKAPSEGPSAPSIDFETMAPMIRALLADRFKMTWHTEDRPESAYTLVSAKPKMKKADPASRTSCKTAPAPAGAPPGSMLLTCQNVTMAQFADRLQNMAPGLNWPVLDSTGIEGGWDFTLTFSRGAPMTIGAGRGGDAGQAATAAPAASDPTGGYTIFEAVEKQLGLKLEMQKRPVPVIVIDHVEQKPTEN